MKLATAVTIALALAGCSKPRDTPSSTTWTTGAGSDYGTMDANVPTGSDIAGAPPGDNATSGAPPFTPVDPPGAYRDEAGPASSVADGGRTGTP